MVNTMDTRILDFFDAIMCMPHVGDGSGSMRIKFHTRAPGITMPPFLSDAFRETMVVALQNQYRMRVGQRNLNLELVFGDRWETLIIPLESIIDFEIDYLPDEEDFSAEYDTSNVISLFSGKEVKF